MAAVWLAKVSASSAERPMESPTDRAPTKESPAAVGSATCSMRTQGMYRGPDGSATAEPKPPSVMTVCATPLARSAAAMARRSASRGPVSSMRSGKWVSCEASCSLGISHETRLSRVSFSSAAGAGFRITGTPASLANRATARLTSRGISSCNSTRSYSAICSRSHDTSDAFSVRLAPGMTMMRFWAVWPETASVTWPTPEWQSDRTMTWLVSTSAFCSGSKSWRPNRSSPTQPTIVTSAPSRAH